MDSATCTGSHASCHCSTYVLLWLLWNGRISDVLLLQFLSSAVWKRTVTARDVFFVTLDTCDNIAELRKCNRGKYGWVEKCDALPKQCLYNGSNSPRQKFCTSQAATALRNHTHNFSSLVFAISFSSRRQANNT